jgi:hypothetical protein
MGSKARGPMLYGFMACKRCVDVSKIVNMQNSHSFTQSSYSLQMSLLVGLPASSDRQVRSYPQLASSPRLSTHIHLGYEQQASDGHGPEMSVSPHHTQSINQSMILVVLKTNTSETLGNNWSTWTINRSWNWLLEIKVTPQNKYGT